MHVSVLHYPGDLDTGDRLIMCCGSPSAQVEELGRRLLRAGRYQLVAEVDVYGDHQGLAHAAFSLTQTDFQKEPTGFYRQKPWNLRDQRGLTVMAEPTSLVGDEMGHRSSDVGDVFVVNGRALICCLNQRAVEFVDIGPAPPLWRPIKTIPREDVPVCIRWQNHDEEVCDLGSNSDPEWWARAGATHWRLATEEEVADFWQETGPLPPGPQKLTAITGIIAVLTTGAACMAATAPIIIKDTNPKILAVMVPISVLSFAAWIATGYLAQWTRR